MIASACMLCVILGATLVIKALQDNKQFFRHPSDILGPAFVQGANPVKVGGLVVEGTIIKHTGLHTEFDVIDFTDPGENPPVLTVKYEGVLPDLFREGQGVVVTGKVAPNRIFIASEVLAKHDENYMPKMPEKMGQS